MLRKLTENISVLPASPNPLSADVGIIYGRERVYLYDVGANEYSLKYINGISGEKSVILSHFHQDHMGNIGLIDCDTVYGGRETLKHLLGNTAGNAKGHMPGNIAGNATGHLPGNTAGNDMAHMPGNAAVNAIDYLPCKVIRENMMHLSGKTSEGEIKSLSDSSGAVKSICVTEKVNIEDGIRIEIIPLPATHAKGSLAMCVNEEYTFLGDAVYTARIKGQVCYNSQLLKSEIEVLDSIKCRFFLLSHDEQFVHEKQEIMDFLKKIYDNRDKSENKFSNYIIMEPVRYN